MDVTTKLKPFTKWTGGKRQLLDVLTPNMPEEYNTYYEPFIGGGALFFEIQPESAVINDLNYDLILSYEAIKNNVSELIEYLKEHDENNSKEYYYDIRSADRDGRYEEMSKTQKAARLMYMLRVNFNGLYRVNSKGQFNTPYGKYKNPKIVDEELLYAISEYLNTNNIQILNTSFENAVKDAQAGDFVYLDPPYVPLSASSSFTAYTSNGFGYKEQILLRDTFVDLDNRGCFVMLSNSSAELVYELYKDYEKTTLEVSANRMINSNAKKRGGVTELLIKNY
ncbi:MAG TPA: DNA adenine methylase [Atopostipes sp.]|nr:DNA adenine methylase [Atopostipes sp.]